MGFREKVSHASKVAALLARHPGQARRVPEWLRRVHEPTIKSGLPWLPFDAIDRLDRAVGRGSRVFEFGGGGSTIWFAERAGQVVTVEHDDDWFTELQAACAGTPNVRLEHRPNPTDSSYIESVAEADLGGPWDVVVVDGRERVRCLQAAAPSVRPGGLLVLDDTDREKYRPAFEFLRGWPHRTYRGLAPMKPMPGQTTFWQRPA